MVRSYGQYCGLARALDVIGDRWNLLIVRQLLVAPARYQELRDGLPGVATNLLADRLRDLEAAGVIERRLAEEGRATTYTLTPWGAQLREPINGLIRWSTPLMIRGPEGDPFPAGGLMVALPALFSGRAPAGQSATVRINVSGGGHCALVRVTDSGIEVIPQDDRDVDAVLSADVQVVLGLAAGVLALDDVRGLVDIHGDDTAVRAVFGAAD